MRKDNENITIRSLILGIIFSALFAILTVVLENRQEMLPTGNQVALFHAALAQVPAMKAVIAAETGK